jgi:hypothetical protein
MDGSLLAMLCNSRGLNLGFEMIKDVSKEGLKESARKRGGINLIYWIGTNAGSYT